MGRKKDLHEGRHLVAYCVVIGLVVFGLLLYLALLVDLAFIMHPSKWTDNLLRVALIVLSALIAIYVLRRLIYFASRRINRRFLSRFEEIPYLGIYKESCAYRFSPHQRIPHITLFLHGFSASPQEFIHVLPSFEKYDLPYYAPVLHGFGLNTTKLLQTVRAEDWLREVVAHYDLLHMFADHVSVVGHSMGGILALYLAQHRRVDRLILSGPGLFVTKDDRKYKKLMEHPLIRTWYTWLVPMFPKPIRKGRKTTSDTLDESNLGDLFQYIAFPSHCVHEVFKVQDEVDISKVQFNELHFLYGEHDRTVDNEALSLYLADHNIDFAEHVFSNSAHNIFEDMDRQLVSEKICEILRR